MTEPVRPEVEREDDAHAPVTTEPATGPRVDESPLADEMYRHGLEIRARSQMELIVRRFLRHKLAVGALIVFIALCMLSFFSKQLAVYDFKNPDPIAGAGNPNYPQSARPAYAHPFGRDPIGRDVYARVLEGTRQSIKVGVGTAFISSAIGTVLGGLAGYYRGRLDNLLMRLTDLVLTIPALAVLLVLSRFGHKIPLVGGIVGKKDATAVLIILSLLVWTAAARLVRGIFLSLREKEYVEAARAVGASDVRIMARHLLPNAVGPIIVQTTLVVASAILLETALSFLGFGIVPPATSLGQMIATSQDSFFFTPWEVWFPGLMIVGICLCINFIGDGLRDALDPTGRR
jgi:peptide/nickel transport system permease protein